MQPKIGFNSYTVAYSTMFFTCLITFILGVVWYWQGVSSFSKYLFFIGFLSSVFDTIGKSFLAHAQSIGPAGPVLAADALTSVLLTIYEAIRLKALPNAM